MLTSELITKLQQLIDAHGDLPVTDAYGYDMYAPEYDPSGTHPTIDIDSENPER